MITVETWEALSEMERMDALSFRDRLFIPTNESGVPSGYYHHSAELPDLMRKFSDNPEAIRFLADMIE